MKLSLSRFEEAVGNLMTYVTFFALLLGASWFACIESVGGTHTFAGGILFDLKLVISMIMGTAISFCIVLYVSIQSQKIFSWFIAEKKELAEFTESSINLSDEEETHVS